MKHRLLLVDTPSSYAPLFTAIFIILFRVCVLLSHMCTPCVQWEERADEKEMSQRCVQSPGLTAHTRINQLHQKIGLAFQLSTTKKGRSFLVSPFTWYVCKRVDWTCKKKKLVRVDLYEVFAWWWWFLWPAINNINVGLIDIYDYTDSIHMSARLAASLQLLGLLCECV